MFEWRTFPINFRYAFRPRKPRLLARLAEAVLRNTLGRASRLRYVDFAVDFPCNLKCEHCFATALKQSHREKMTLDDYARVADQAMDLGAVNFSFQGGEPLLFQNLPQIIRACKPDRNVISVSTNGTLLNEDRVRELKHIGVDILTVSLDSSIPAEHDAFRGASGAFEKTFSGIRAALRQGLHVTLGTVVTHQSLRSEGITGLFRIAEDLRTVLYLILPVPAGQWKGRDDFLLTPDDLEYIDRLTKQSPYIRTDFQANLGALGCGAAKEILYLTPYGDVLPCPFLHISMGNIKEKNLADIRQTALANPYFDHYHQTCLASTDPDFIRRFLSKTFDAQDLPLPWDQVFSIHSPAPEEKKEKPLCMCS